jgi:hypothetical protein
VRAHDIADHLPGRQIERAFGRRAHRERHRTRRTKRNSLGRGFLPWPDSDSLRKQIDRDRFVAGLDLSITAQTIGVFHAFAAPRSTGAPSYFRQCAGQLTSMQKDSREENSCQDGDGSEATFNSGSSLTVKVAVSNGTKNAPTCAPNSGTTGETNNLNLGSCAGTGAATPYIEFVESN